MSSVYKTLNISDLTVFPYKTSKAFNLNTTANTHILVVSASCKDWYYYGPDGVYITPPVSASTNVPSGSIGYSDHGYTYITSSYSGNPSGALQVGKYMSYNSWPSGTWKYAGPNYDIAINDMSSSYTHINPKNPPYDGSQPVVYGFNLLNFNVITRNDEVAGVYAPVYMGGVNNYCYTVPRSGSYTVTAQVPITVLTNQNNTIGPDYFKVAAILEKCPSGSSPSVESNWGLASPYSFSRLQNSVTFPNTDPMFPSANAPYMIVYNDPVNSRSVDNTLVFGGWSDRTYAGIQTICGLNTTFTANTGDILRLQLYIIDVAQFFNNELNQLTTANNRLQMFFNGYYNLDASGSTNNRFYSDPNHTTGSQMLIYPALISPTSPSASLIIADTNATATTYTNPANITIATGSNLPLPSFGSANYKEVLTYRSARHLYYSHNLPGLQPSTPLSQQTYNQLVADQNINSTVNPVLVYDNYLQSTACSGSSEYDNRSTFVTGSGSNLVHVLSVSQTLFGEQIQPNSFSVTSLNADFNNFEDDGNGNLIDSATKSIVIGNIIYAHGVVVINNLNYSPYARGYSMTVNSETTIYQSQVRCHINENEFNMTTNPSATSGSFGVLNSNVSGSSFQPYVTTIGLYNGANELIAVGKLGQPFPMPANTDVTFVVRWDS